MYNIIYSRSYLRRVIGITHKTFLLFCNLCLNKVFLRDEISNLNYRLTVSCLHCSYRNPLYNIYDIEYHSMIPKLIECIIIIFFKGNKLSCI